MSLAAAEPILVRVNAETFSTAAGTLASDDAGIATLTGRMAAGDEAAWVEFHAQYFDRLLRYLLVLCRGDEQAARDGLQAVLVKVARHVRKFECEAAWWSWLTVVARSCAIDQARGRSRYRQLLERYAGFFRQPAPAAPFADLSEVLEACLADLTPGERALVVAKYLEGRMVADLASEAGCSEKALESRLARLRVRLKEKLLHRLRHEN
jgi:RNA polymerase sigma-70 factor (ECF subfamily)